MTKKTSYSKEFKLEALRQLDLGARPGTEIARDLGIRRNLLYKWQEQLSQNGEGAFQGSGRKPANQSDKVTRLEKELAEVKMEREILKKASVSSMGHCNTFKQYFTWCLVV